MPNEQMRQFVKERNVVIIAQNSSKAAGLSSEAEHYIALDNSWKKDKGMHLTITRTKGRSFSGSPKPFFLDFNSPFDVKR